MAALPPSYREHGQTYRADACRPVAEAVAARRIEYVALVRGQYPGTKLPRNVLGGVRNVGWWNIETPQEWGLAPHRNEGIELTFLERGSLVFAIDDVAHRLEPGDLTFARPWQQHWLGGPNVTPSRLHWLILDVGVRQPHQSWRWPPWLVLTENDLNELTTMLRQAVDAVWHVGNEVLQCFRRIADAVERDRAGSSASRLAAYFNELFVLLLDLLREGTISFNRSLASAAQTVELFWKEIQQSPDYMAHPWTVHQMARECGMGVTQFATVSKRLANLTPVEQLNRCRVEAAADMLRVESSRNVTHVALACGFSSGQYFAKVFRQLKGCSPTEYRQAAVGVR